MQHSFIAITIPICFILIILGVYVLCRKSQAPSFVGDEDAGSALPVESPHGRTIRDVEAGLWLRPQVPRISRVRPLNDEFGDLGLGTFDGQDGEEELPAYEPSVGAGFLMVDGQDDGWDLGVRPPEYEYNYNPWE